MRAAWHGREQPCQNGFNGGRPPLGGKSAPMFRLDKEEALLAAFRPKDRQPMALPPGAAFPLVVRDCLSWTHPVGGRVYLIFAAPGGAPTGIVFESGGGSGAGVPHMCDWCHFVGAGDQVGLLTA